MRRNQYLYTIRYNVVRCLIKKREFSDAVASALGCNLAFFARYIGAIMRPGMTMDNIIQDWTIGFIDRDPSLSDAYRSHYTNLAPLRKKSRSNHTIIPFAGDGSCDDDEIVTATVVDDRIIIDLDSDDLPSFNTRSRKRPAAGDPSYPPNKRTKTEM